MYFLHFEINNMYKGKNVYILRTVFLIIMLKQKKGREGKYISTGSSNDAAIYVADNKNK